MHVQHKPICLQRFQLTLVACMLLFVSCIKEIKVPVRSVAPKLVVEGSITTDSVPYRVKLSFSGPYVSGISIPDSLIVEDATVIVSENTGRETLLTHVGNGVYETNDVAFVGISGRSYQVHITLSDGREYLSQPEVLPSPVPVERVSKVEFDFHYDFNKPTDFKIFVDVNDPAGEENFYKWTAISWVPRLATGVPCGNYCIKWQYCHQLTERNYLHFISDASVNGNIVREQLVYRSPIYYFGRHYVDISQLTITREAYQFWKRFNDQENKSGSILDPLPAPIEGNIYNANNPDDLALGFFSASAVSHKKVILIPYNVTQFLLDVTAKHFIGEGGCHLIYPNAIEFPPPGGWENAETIEVHW